METIDRFLDKVQFEPMSGCWLWTASRGTGGYGQFGLGPRTAKRRLFGAHQISYKLFKGEVPEGLVLDHICEVRSCVNADHLRPVTHRFNILRGSAPSAKAARATHCPQGHAYEGKNLYITPLGDRKCRTCHRERYRKAHGLEGSGRFYGGSDK